MRFTLGSFTLTLAALVAFSAAADAGPTPTPQCQYVHVTDPCQNDLLIFDAGEEFITHNIPLHLGLPGGYEVGGVDFAEVPGFRDKYSFVAQGPYLRVIKHELAVVWRTVDVELAVGLPNLHLQRVHAAGPVTIGGQTRYPLYLSGYKTTPGGFEPVYIVLDQEALLAYYFNYNSIEIDSGSVCIEGNACRGVALDISAGASLSSGPLQEAYVTVIDYVDSDRFQRIYHLTLEADGNVTVSLDPWNDEGVVFSGAAHRSIGLDFDRTGVVPVGLFQTTAVDTNLINGEASCALPGDPTDIEVWGPSGNNQSYYHFVTSRDASGDHLLAYPPNECPTTGGPHTLSLPAGDYARGIGISSDTDDQIWVYTANKDHGITAVEMQILNSGPTVLQTLDIPFQGCPMDIAFRDPSITICNAFEDQPDPAYPIEQGPGLDDPDDPDECPEDSTDPQCIDPGGPSGPLEDCPPGGCTLRLPGGR